MNIRRNRTSARRVLVADDDADIRKVVKVNLEAEGFSVETAANGWDAQVKALTTLPDLVVLDITMPGPSGLDVLARLRGHQATRDIPVVLLTARTSDEDVLDWLESRCGLLLDQAVQCGRANALRSLPVRCASDWHMSASKRYGPGWVARDGAPTIRHALNTAAAGALDACGIIVLGFGYASIMALALVTVATAPSLGKAFNSSNCADSVALALIGLVGLVVGDGALRAATRLAEEAPSSTLLTNASGTATNFDPVQPRVRGYMPKSVLLSNSGSA